MSERTMVEVAAELAACAGAWEPGARVIGNVTAAELLTLLAAANEERGQVAAMKLRAVAAHEAIWRVMNGRPSDALRSLMDDGEVHEAVHAIIAVDTESVSVPDEWRAHVERQDRRIEALEAQAVSDAEEAERWRGVARKLGAAADRERAAADALADELARDCAERGVCPACGAEWNADEPEWHRDWCTLAAYRAARGGGA